ncbi:DUF6297 family protein [Rhodococcus sp. NPDC060090]|uniref:DUF6297 family protein n=1 Tax=Rhodococcus sp. NPDC060090 TaxID=3347056 RepID=UPI0036627420
MALTDTPASIPTVRTVYSLRRSFERSHIPRSHREGMIFVSVLGAYVCGGLVWWLVTRPPTVLTESLLFEGDRGQGATWGWAVFAILAAVATAASRSLGPVTTGGDTVWWVLSTPVDRGAVLRPRVLTVLCTGAVAGAVAGRLAAFAAALGNWLPLTVFGASIGLGVVAVAVLVQCRVLPAWAPHVLAAVFAVTGSAAALCAAVGVAVPMIATWAPIVLAWVVVLPVGIAAVSVCSRIGLAELAVGADMNVAASVALTSLDLSVLTGATEQRAWRRVARCPSRALPRGRARALIWSDALRHRRRPSSLLVAAGAVFAGWALAAMLSPIASALAQLVLVSGVAMVFSGGLRDLSDNGELRVMLGAGDRALRIPLMVVPITAAATTAFLTAFLAAMNPVVMMIVLVGGCVAAYRARTHPHTDYDGLILETAVGQIPVDLIRQRMRGPDVVVAAALLLVLVS